MRVLFADRAEAAGPLTAGSAAVAVPVGDYPFALRVTPDQRHAYVAASGDDVISVVDLHRRTLLENVAVGNRPLDIAFNASGTTAYVANQGGGSISVIDTRTRRVIRTLPVGGSPSGLIVVRRNHAEHLFVADFSGSQVELVDPTNGSVTHRWPVDEPAGVAVTADGTVVAPSAQDPEPGPVANPDGRQQPVAGRGRPGPCPSHTGPGCERWIRAADPAVVGVPDPVTGGRGTGSF